MGRSEAESFLYHEARLLDERRLEEWLGLFAADTLYWIPIDEAQPASETVAIVRDDRLRLEERVYHLLHTTFPSQSPPSRTIHMVTNVEAQTLPSGEVTLRSNQLVYEVRTGDYRQVGLGRPRALAAQVEHRLRPTADGMRITLKKILLIDRDMPQGNLIFLI